MKHGYEVSGFQDGRQNYDLLKQHSNQSVYNTNLGVGVPLKWFVSQAPYLVHESAIAPHVTGSGVLLEIESLC